MSLERALDSLLDRLREQLAERGIFDADVRIADTTVVLHGQAESAAHSRTAEQLVRDRVFGHMNVVNELWIAS